MVKKTFSTLRFVLALCMPHYIKLPLNYIMLARRTSRTFAWNPCTYLLADNTKTKPMAREYLSTKNKT
jgi:hypothetical protein